MLNGGSQARCAIEIVRGIGCCLPKHGRNINIFTTETRSHHPRPLQRAIGPQVKHTYPEWIMQNNEHEQVLVVDKKTQIIKCFSKCWRDSFPRSNQSHFQTARSVDGASTAAGAARVRADCRVTSPRECVLRDSVRRAGVEWRAIRVRIIVNDAVEMCAFVYGHVSSWKNEALGIIVCFIQKFSSFRHLVVTPASLQIPISLLQTSTSAPQPPQSAALTPSASTRRARSSAPASAASTSKGDYARVSSARLFFITRVAARWRTFEGTGKGRGWKDLASSPLLPPGDSIAR